MDEAETSFTVDNTEEESSDSLVPGENEVIRSITKRKLHFHRDHKYLTAVQTGSMLAGVVMGVFIRMLDSDFKNNDSKKQLLAIPGILLVRMLSCIVLPLVVSSIISLIVLARPRAPTQPTLRIVLYFLGTGLTSLLISLAFIQLLRLGEDPMKIPDHVLSHSAAIDVLDLFKRIFPENLIKMSYTTVLTLYSMTNETTYTLYQDNVTEANTTAIDKRLEEYELDNVNILGMLMFSIIFGCCASQLHDDENHFYSYFVAFEQTMFKMLSIVLFISPFGIFFLAAYLVLDMADPLQCSILIGLYIVAVLSSMLVHVFIFLPILYRILVKANPFRFFFKVVKALGSAWKTASGAAALPATNLCLAGAGLSLDMIDRVLPFATIINPNGFIYYEGMASVFIAYYIGERLTLGMMIVRMLSATMAGACTIAIPSNSLISMIIVLNAFGLPVQYLSLMVLVEWLLDSLKAVVNVWEDCIVTAYIDNLPDPFN